MLKHYGIGILVSLTLHTVLLAFLIGRSETERVVKTVRPQNYIEAKLVELKPKVKNPPKPKPKIIDLTAKRKEKDRKMREAQQKKKRLKAQQDKEARLKAEIKKKRLKNSREKEARERQRQAEQERQKANLAQMEQALLEEQDELLEEQHEVVAQGYAAKIQKLVEQNWSRPPSARNGMRCELEIEMVPSGRVINVEVKKSSGNLAFDRSAVAAVKKIEVFPGIRDIPIDIFENYFREFSLAFQPEDLRQ